ncbi:MAG TPA: tetratricopeptide repeat protein, partial [Sphingomonadales bacterium]|nr:tetratricopeptide repeat protein [Sphingomonadales bacterium]
MEFLPGNGWQKLGRRGAALGLGLVFASLGVFSLSLIGSGLLSLKGSLLSPRLQISTAQEDAIIATLTRDTNAASEERAALRNAVQELERTLHEGRDPALGALLEGDVAKAEALFADLLAENESQGSKFYAEAAAAARHLGALAFFTDTDKAVRAYSKAAELAPENLEGWMQLGRLQERTGKVAEAEKIYQNLRQKAEVKNDKRWIALASNQLGIMDVTSGNLKQAELNFGMALGLAQDLGDPLLTAETLANFGSIYYFRGDLERAR